MFVGSAKGITANVPILYTHYEVLETLAEKEHTEVSELMDEILENYLDTYLELFDTSKEKLKDWRENHE